MFSSYGDELSRWASGLSSCESGLLEYASGLSGGVISFLSMYLVLEMEYNWYPN